MQKTTPYTESEFEPRTSEKHATDITEEGDPRKLRMWAHNETLSLIASIKDHYDNLNHPKKRKDVWNLIAEDLQSLNIKASPKECQTKWRNLIRSYNNVKDNSKMTGRGSVRFQFLDEMDEILGDKPTNKSVHVIDPSNNESTIPSSSQNLEITNLPGSSYTTSENEMERSGESNPVKDNARKKSIKKRKYSTEIAELDRQRLEYYKDKRVFLKDETLRREEERKNKEERNTEKLSLKKEKLKLEMQKINLLRQYLKLKVPDDKWNEED